MQSPRKRSCVEVRSPLGTCQAHDLWCGVLKRLWISHVQEMSGNSCGSRVAASGLEPLTSRCLSSYSRAQQSAEAHA